MRSARRAGGASSNTRVRALPLNTHEFFMLFCYSNEFVCYDCTSAIEMHGLSHERVDSSVAGR